MANFWVVCFKKRNFLKIYQLSICFASLKVILFDKDKHTTSYRVFSKEVYIFNLKLQTLNFQFFGSHLRPRILTWVHLIQLCRFLFQFIKPKIWFVWPLLLFNKEFYSLILLLDSHFNWALTWKQVMSDFLLAMMKRKFLSVQVLLLSYW